MKKVNIGAEKKREGWIGVNIDPQWEVDVIADAENLPFEDGEIDVIYISHVLEHITYKDKKLMGVVQELHRCLKPGGTLYISVPDFEVLCKWYLSTEGKDRLHIMRMMLGGQTTEHDTHRVGFDEQLLRNYLRAVGFSSISRIERFGVFDDDCSDVAVNGHNISINLIATRS